MERRHWLEQAKDRLNVLNRNYALVAFAAPFLAFLLTAAYVLFAHPTLSRYTGASPSMGIMILLFFGSLWVFWNTSTRRFVRPHQVLGVEYLAYRIGRVAVDLLAITNEPALPNTLTYDCRRVKATADEIIDTLNPSVNRLHLDELRALKDIIEKINTMKSDPARHRTRLRSFAARLIRDAKHMYKAKSLDGHGISFVKENARLGQVKKTSVGQDVISGLRSGWLSRGRPTKLVVILIAWFVVDYCLPIEDRVTPGVAIGGVILGHFLLTSKYGFGKD